MRDPKALKRWHLAINSYFGIFAVGYTAFLVRLPHIKDLLNVSTSLLGIIILIGAIGSITGLNISGRLIEKIGTKPAIVIGALSHLAGLTLMAGFAQLHSWVAYMIAGILMGGGAGFTDVALNLDGTVLERETGRSLMPRMHAAYSIGTFLGAALGTLAEAVSLPIFAQVVASTLIQGAIALSLVRFLPAKTGVQAKSSTGEKISSGAWLNRVVLFLGLGILVLSIGEGASNDWLTIGLVQGYHIDGAAAGVAYTLLLGAMTATRFWGGKLAERFGKGRTMQALALVGAAGVAIMVLGAPNLWAAYLGAILWGAGVALAFPLLLSAAGEGEHAGKRVAFVASWGYGAFIAGPALLGYLGQAWGMLPMFWMIAFFIASAIVFASAASNRPVKN